MLLPRGKLKNGILELCERKECSLKELEEKLKIDHKNLFLAVKELEADRLLTIRKDTKRRGHPIFIKTRPIRASIMDLLLFRQKVDIVLDKVLKEFKESNIKELSSDELMKLPYNLNFGEAGWVLNHIFVELELSKKGKYKLKLIKGR